ncbi:hypothetical protein B0H13DRAFT_2678123 [Mycena leptocephala]|nr:hypothetical protein B0H13DRAFT_2678123 [Mycena leptocephala]
MEEENILMQELADKEEDARPDDGAIEIDSDEEYQPLKSQVAAPNCTPGACLWLAFCTASYSPLPQVLPFNVLSHLATSDFALRRISAACGSIPRASLSSLSMSCEQIASCSRFGLFVPRSSILALRTLYKVF